jgi:hypothetical protein
LGVPLKATVVVEYSGGRKMIVQQAVYRALPITMRLNEDGTGSQTLFPSTQKQQSRLEFAQYGV